MEFLNLLGPPSTPGERTGPTGDRSDQGPESSGTRSDVSRLGWFQGASEATSDCDLDELHPYETSLDSWFCVGELGSTGFGDRLESLRTRLLSVAVRTHICYTGRGRIVVTK